MQKRETLHDKNILLGITGSVASTKAVALVTLLCEAGANVKIIATESGLKFLSTAEQELIGPENIFSDIFAEDVMRMDHITLAKWADVLLVAPASASLLSRFAIGLADQLLSLTYLATDAAVLIAPAMNQQMWQQAAVQRNAQQLTQDGCYLLGPADGEQACGDVGFGRMIEPVELCDYMADFFRQTAKDLTVLITAGPTQEAIDPVRYISNRSSGKMGYALAETFTAQGAQVILVSGPTALAVPKLTKFVQVTSASEMCAAVLEHGTECDVIISAAAIADYSVQTIARQKIKKHNNDWGLSLARTEDVLMQTRTAFPDVFLVGFALETEDLLTQAEQKLQRKDLDMIIANEFSDANPVFDSDKNKVVVLSKINKLVELPMQSKRVLADDLVSLICASLHE